jgi:hypothetical protein
MSTADFPIHQVPLEESDDAIAVRVIADIVRRLQFNQRHAAHSLFVNDGYLKNNR